MFDIIIPTYKNTVALQKCLEGFENQNFKNFQIFLCINGNPTSTLDFLKVFNSNLKLKSLFFEDFQNHGRAANRNQALPYLTHKYTLYHDSDLIPNPDLLEQHLTTLTSKECISVGMVEYTNRSENLWAEYQYYTGRAKYKNQQVIPFQYLNTQNTALPTHYIQKVGGQDANLLHYGGDDTELAYRLQKQFNPLFIFNEKAVCYGEMDKTISKALDDVYEFGKYNFPKIIKKHPNFNEIYKIGMYLSN